MQRLPGAGAGILAIDPDAESAARTEAIDFAALNLVQGDVAVVLPADVVVNLDSSTVTVDVRRIQSRGTAVGTYFARIFGVSSVDVSATATAIAEPVGPGSGTNCLLPIMLPDRWAESGADPNYNFPSVNDSYDPEVRWLDRIFTETAGGVALGVTRKLVAQGKIKPQDRTVIANTGNGLKTQDALNLQSPKAIEAKLEAFDAALNELDLTA